MINYDVTFNFMKDLEKSIMVKKKTKKIDKVFFIPKSIVVKQSTYDQEKSLDKGVKYTRKRITLTLPKWYCDKELGFYK